MLHQPGSSPVIVFTRLSREPTSPLNREPLLYCYYDDGGLLEDNQGAMLS